MARRTKSSPFAVRLSIPLAEWVEKYAEEQKTTKSDVFERALVRFRKAEGRKNNGRKKILLDTIKRATRGADSTQPQ